MVSLGLLAAVPALAALYFGYRAYRFSSLDWPEQASDAQLVAMAGRYLGRHGWRCETLERGQAVAARKGEGSLVLVPLGALAPAAGAEAGILAGLALAPLTPERVDEAARKGMFALYYKDLADLGALADTSINSLHAFLAERSFAESEPLGVAGWSQEPAPDAWPGSAERRAELGGAWAPAEPPRPGTGTPSVAPILPVRAEQPAPEPRAAAETPAAERGTGARESGPRIVDEPVIPETRPVPSGGPAAASPAGKIGAPGPLAAPVSGGAAAEPNQAALVRDRLEEGRRALEARKLDEAERAFRAVLAVEASHAGAFGGLAAALAQMGRVDEAITAAQAGIRTAPKSAGLTVQLGNLFNRREDWDDARQCFEKALALAPKNVPALTSLAIAEAKLGRTEAALAALDKAIGLEPSSVRLHVQHGQMLLAAARPADAEAAFRRAEALQPAHPGAWTGVLSALREQDKPDEAAAFLEKMVAEHPDDARLRERLRLLRPDKKADDSAKK